MEPHFRLSPCVRSRFVLLLVAGVLIAVGPPPGAQSTGGAPISFEPDLKISGLPSDPANMHHVETSAAANPKDSRNVVAAYMDLIFGSVEYRPCSFSTTSDGGQSWAVQGDAPLAPLPGLNACSDPSVAADGRGTFYLSYLDENFNPATGVDNYDLRVARSTDKGKSFKTSTVAVFGGPDSAVDKPLMAADGQPRSRFRGTVYVTYTNDLPINGIYVVVSRDSATTWSSPVHLDGPQGTEILVLGSAPVVAPDGTVYIFWARFPYYVSPMSIRFSKSTDGGATWSPAANVATGVPSPGQFYLKNADPEFGSTPDRGIVGNSFPMAAAAPDGAVYVTWTDFPDGSCRKSQSTGPVPPCTNADVRLAVSRDGGASWSAPVKFSDETNATDQFYPTITAQSNGLVSLAWIDRRLDPDNINYDVFYTNTFDGVNFLPNVRVTTASSLVGLAQFIGDYNGMAATDDAVFPVWGDLRGGVPVQVYTSRGALAP